MSKKVAIDTFVLKKTYEQQVLSSVNILVYLNENVIKKGVEAL